VVAGSLAGLLWSALDRSQLVNTSLFSACNAGTYASGIVAFAAALVLLLYVLLRQRVAPADLTAGAFAWCAVLMVLTSLFAPGASFLFTWPLLFSLLALVLIFAARGADSWFSRLLSLLGAALAVDMFCRSHRLRSHHTGRRAKPIYDRGWSSGCGHIGEPRTAA
jgi:hypothetical protein